MQTVVEDKTINAWCMPGGKVVFYTGIMPICDNINGVAAVMGHEVAHAFAKHGQERMTSSYGQQIGGLLVTLGTSKEDSQTKQIWNTAFGVGSMPAAVVGEEIELKANGEFVQN